MKKVLACLSALSLLLLAIPVFGLFTAAEATKKTQYLTQVDYEDAGWDAVWGGAGFATHSLVEGGKDSAHALQSVMNEGAGQNRLQTLFGFGEADNQMKLGTLYTFRFDVKSTQGVTAPLKMVASYVTSENRAAEVTLSIGTALTETDWLEIAAQIGASVTPENKLHVTWKRPDTGLLEQDLLDLHEGETITGLQLFTLLENVQTVYYDNVEVFWEESVSPPSSSEVSTPSAARIIPNGDFESGTTEPWITFGLSDLSLAPEQGVNGSTALKTVKKDSSDQARATVNLGNAFEMNTVYDIQSNLKAETGKSGSTLLMLIVSTEEQGDVSLVVDTLAVKDQWSAYHTYLKFSETEEGLQIEYLKNNRKKEEFAITGDSLTIKGYYLLWLSSDMPAYYLDDLTAEKKADFPGEDEDAPIIENSDFENGSAAPWYTNGYSTLSVEENGGSKALKVVKNSGVDQNRAQVLLGKNAIKLDTTYKLSTRLFSEDKGTIKILFLVDTKEMGAQGVVLDMIETGAGWASVEQALRVTRDDEVLEMQYTNSKGKTELWGLEGDEITITGWHLIYLSDDLPLFYLDDASMAEGQPPAPPVSSEPDTSENSQVTAPSSSAGEPVSNVDTGERSALPRVLLPMAAVCGMLLVLAIGKKQKQRI